MTTLTKWTRPNYYIGETWEDYYLSGFDHHRDSDCLQESNFVTALRALGGESETVLVVRERHWLVGWVEWIAIHESDTKAISIAEELCQRRRDYPALDEDDWSAREYEAAQQIWQDCYNDADRIAFMRDHQIDHQFASFGELRSHVRGEFFAGYATDLLG